MQSSALQSNALYLAAFLISAVKCNVVVACVNKFYVDNVSVHMYNVVNYISVMYSEVNEKCSYLKYRTLSCIAAMEVHFYII